ncbi:MAG: SLBB domain-containing protein, partial [Armatimonadota bacterium]
VVGMVKKPGTVDAIEGNGLRDLISKAGGTLPNADKTKVRIFTPGIAQPRVVNLDQIELGYSGDIPIKPGARIEVTNNRGRLDDNTVKIAAGAAVLLFLLGR